MRLKPPRIPPLPLGAATTPARRRAAQAVLLALGLFATLALYLVAGRPAAHRVTVVVQSAAPPAASAVAAATTPQPARRATPRPTTAVRATATAAPQPAGPTDADVTPAGGMVTQRLDLPFDGSTVEAVAVSGTVADTGACPRPFLRVYTRQNGAWAPAFDASAAPEGAPLLPAAEAAGSACFPQVAVMKAYSATAGTWIAAGVQRADGTSRLVVTGWSSGDVTTAPAIALDLTTDGAGALAETANGQGIEIDEDATAPPGTPVSGPIGTWARLVHLGPGGPLITQRLVPNCDRGRLLAGSAAGLTGALAGQPGAIAIACSSGKQAAATVNAATLLDPLGAVAASVRDRDYVEVEYADDSLAPPVDGANSEPAPYAVLVSDASAVSRGTRSAAPQGSGASGPATRAPTRASAPRSASGSGAASTSGSSSSHARSTGGANASGASAPAANPVPTDAVPINPNRARPPVQPPSAPRGVPGAAPPAP